MSGLRLHGYPVSNYVNVVRAALIEKRLPYELVIAGAAQDDAFLALNPMGKIPVLDDEGFVLGETVAILEYLDERFPAPPLWPDDIGRRARGRQIVNVVQMYVEAPARSLFPGVFMGAENGVATISAARTWLDRSTRALALLLKPRPFLLGPAISNADLFAFYNLDIADRVTRFVYGRSIREEIGTIDAWHEAMLARASTQTVLADFETYFARYLTEKGAVYRAPCPTSATGLPSHA